MENARVFAPDVLKCEDTVIVTTNHLGASIEASDGSTLGDSGKDAQRLANISGMRVIGLDRPHSGNKQRYNQADSQVWINQPEVIAGAWAAKILPAFNETGASRIELVGKSVGANLLLEVALLEELPVTGIVAVEPVAMGKISSLKAVTRYAKYKFANEGQISPALGRIDEGVTETINEAANMEGSLTRNLQKLRRHLLDYRQNRRYWTTDRGLLACALIAARQKQTKTLFTFAHFPLSRDREDLEISVRSLNTLRPNRIGIAPLLADFVPDTRHNSFDDRRLYVAQYLRYKNLGSTGNVTSQRIETVKTELL